MKDHSIKSPNTGNTGQKNLAEEILDTLWEPLLVLEDDLRVQSANDAFYHHFKVEPAETVGRQVYDLGNGQWDIPLLRELLEEVLPKETFLRDFEIEHTFEKIGRRALLLNARRIDNLQLILLAMEDITDRKENEALREAKAVAEESNRAKSQFLANMSHEIRSPMTVFLAAIELLLQLDKDPERRKFLEMADQSAQRLRGLIDGILDFSRIEARKVDLEEQPLDLRDCVQGTVQMLDGQAQEKNLRLEIEVSPAIPAIVLGDPGRLRQILLNLVGNAIKFTHQGEVRVSVMLSGEHLEFAVSDTGIGIPEEKREMIFERFTQADNSFKREYGGTGLGLAISKGLVELMGGQIGVRARPGGGSVFFFTLQLKPAPGDQTATAEDRTEATTTPLSSTRILVVDDHPMLRDVIQIGLTQRGWSSETAENGVEAVKKWKEGNFDLILMDLQMPKMNGLEATRAIREAEEGKQICILGLTAHARREVIVECLAAGMDSVLSKPVQLNELYSAIESCLSERITNGSFSPP